MAPPANAWPLTAAIVGTGKDIIGAQMCCTSATIAIGSAISGLLNAAPCHLRSRPFEKNLSDAEGSCSAEIEIDGSLT